MRTLQKMNLSELPYVIMAILNVTPDSFSDGGNFNTIEKAVLGAKQMIAEGAHIIDIGGESTRPKAIPISLQEELDRAIPVIEQIRKFSNVPISIDTTKASVADAALLAGADIINDISACTQDSNMIATIIKHKAPTILMHRQGTPANMQENPTYQDVCKEVIDFLNQQANLLQSKGLAKNQIILDPGIGFGKTYEHNLALIKNISKIKMTGCEILLGVSRKSLFQKMIGADVNDRLIGTTAVNAFALSQGVRFFRVHDIKANKQALEATKILIGK
jgi:dihydropteroate synthase